MTTGAGAPTYLVTIDGEIAARVRLADGPPVLWLHGYTLDSRIWSALWDRLPGWSHVGIDLPGHGGSAPLGPTDDLPTVADRIGRLAIGLGISRLVALSFGTTLAIEVAGRFPEAIRALVLGAPSLAGGPRDPDARRLYRELIGRYLRAGPGQHLREIWMAPSSGIFRHARRRPELWRCLWDVVGRHRWSELGDGSLRRLLDHHQDDAALRNIAAATLLLVGEHELPTFAACATHIESVVARCRRVQLRAVGHLCLLEDPDAAARAIDDHLRAGDAVPNGAGGGAARGSGATAASRRVSAPSSSRRVSAPAQKVTAGADTSTLNRSMGHG